MKLTNQEKLILDVLRRFQKNPETIAAALEAASIGLSILDKDGSLETACGDADPFACRELIDELSEAAKEE